MHSFYHLAIPRQRLSSQGLILGNSPKDSLAILAYFNLMPFDDLPIAAQTLF